MDPSSTSGRVVHDVPLPAAATVGGVRETILDNKNPHTRTHARTSGTYSRQGRSNLAFFGKIFLFFLLKQPRLKGKIVFPENCCCCFCPLGLAAGALESSSCSSFFTRLQNKNKTPKFFGFSFLNLFPQEKRTNFCLESHRHGTDDDDDGTLLDDGIDAGCRKGKRRRRDAEFSRYSRRRFSPGKEEMHTHPWVFFLGKYSLKRDDDDDETRILAFGVFFSFFL